MAHGECFSQPNAAGQSHCRGGIGLLDGWPFGTFGGAMSGRFWESLKHPGSEHRKTSQPPSSNLTRFRTPTPSVPSHGSRLRSLSLSLFSLFFDRWPPTYWRWPPTLRTYWPFVSSAGPCTSKGGCRVGCLADRGRGPRHRCLRRGGPWTGLGAGLGSAGPRRAPGFMGADEVTGVWPV